MITSKSPYPIHVLHSKPTNVASAAVYPFKEKFMDIGARKSKFKAEDGSDEYNLFRVVGAGHHKRIWVPRNMAPDVVEDLRVRGVDCKTVSTFKPRNSEQERCGPAILALLKNDQSFIFRAPPGFGKTWLTTDVIVKMGKKTIVVVTKEDILDQWVAAIEKLTPLRLGKGKGIGIIRGDTCDTLGQTIVIAMVHSLAKEDRYPEHHFRDFGLVVFDECHRIGADFFSQACFRLPALLRLGISATPDRKDGREEVLYAHIGPVLVETDMAPMTPRVIKQKSPWQIPMKRKLDKDGRVVMKDNKVVMVPMAHSPGRTGHIVRMMTNHHGRNVMIARFVAQCFLKGRKVLVQSERLDHLQELTTLISSFKVPPAKITLYVGGLTKAQRELAKTGAVIMATYKMTAEATDIPDIDTLVMGTPMSDVRQIVGRATRFLEGKKEPILFDIVDDSSPVFAGYAKNRMELYASLGATVKEHLPN